MQPYCFGLRASGFSRLTPRLPLAYNKCERILFLPFVLTFSIPFQSTFGTQNIVELPLLIVSSEILLLSNYV